MAVIVELFVVSATAGNPGRSFSKRPDSSAARCWASAADPPLPNDTTMPFLRRHSTMAMAAFSMSADSRARERSVRLDSQRDSTIFSCQWLLAPFFASTTWVDDIEPLGRHFDGEMFFDEIRAHVAAAESVVGQHFAVERDRGLHAFHQEFAQ